MTAARSIASQFLADTMVRTPALLDDIAASGRATTARGMWFGLTAAHTRGHLIRAILEGVAFSLPNDPKVWEAKGAKKVMMGNYLDARRTEVLTPLASTILAEEAAQQVLPNKGSVLLTVTEQDKHGSIGIPIPGVELRVVDERGVELPRGETGHLVARGDKLFDPVRSKSYSVL